MIGIRTCPRLADGPISVKSLIPYQYRYPLRSLQLIGLPRETWLKILQLRDLIFELVRAQKNVTLHSNSNDYYLVNTSYIQDDIYLIPPTIIQTLHQIQNSTPAGASCSRITFP